MPEICPPPDPAACLVRCHLHKRRCVAAGIETARKQCKAGKPVCMRGCNPESCRAMCDIGEDAGDRTPDVEPVAEAAPQSALERDPTGEQPTDGDVCVPAVDRECLGACAPELRECARRVHEAGRQCRRRFVDARSTVARSSR
ncbi:MAG: hypothetical protein V3R77_10400 [Candidatus Binatia bacterium]